MIFNRAKTTTDRRSNNKVTQKCQRGKFSLTKKSGNLDQGLSSLVDLIIYWYKPQPAIDPNSGARQFIHKFQGSVWQTSYTYLMKKLGASKSTIRRRIIKLEQLGYIKREFKDILVNGQEYNNRLFIHLSNSFFKRVTGFNKASYNGEDKMLIDQRGFTALSAEQLSHSTNYSKNADNVAPPSDQKKEVLNIDIYNTIFKNRSNKSDSAKNEVKAKAATIKMQEEVNKEQVEEEKAKHDHAADNGDYDDNNDSTGNKALDKQIEPSKVSRQPLITNSWLGNSVKTFALKAMVKVKSYKRKALSEFHPLSEEEAEVLRKTSGRE
ncbi:MAG: helix-turn-helix domain-containing protein, partial [Rickettsiaceae bacterium]